MLCNTRLLTAVGISTKCVMSGLHSIGGWALRASLPHRSLVLCRYLLSGLAPIVTVSVQIIHALRCQLALASAAYELSFPMDISIYSSVATADVGVMPM